MQRDTQKESRKFPGLYRTLALWVGGVCWAVTAWWFFLPPPRAFVEDWFSRGWYRLLLAWTTPMTQSVPFPIALLLILLGPAAFFLLWMKNWIAFRRDGPAHWKSLFWAIRSLLLVVPLLVVWFVVFWGAGYRRIPVEERLGFEASPITGFEAAGLQDLLAREVKRNLTLVQRRDAGRAVSSIASAMERIVAKWDGEPIDLPSRVKAVPPGLLLSGGTSGVCAPFTLEAIVDAGLPDTASVYSAAHELGHIAGFCGEDEASFVGYVAGLHSEDAFARYACALNAYVDLISRLGDSKSREAFAVLPEAARQDLKGISEAYRRYHINWFSRLSRRTYNRYLQVQGIKEGIQNYSHGITLLAYAWRKGML